MHLLKPNTRYKIVRVMLACPAELTDGEIADAINEPLNMLLVQGQENIVDWNIDFGFDQLTSSAEAEEGELFAPIGRAAI